MSKLLTLAVLLSTSIFTITASADDSALMEALSTKNIVRMKLWYDGIDTIENNGQSDGKSHSKPLSEELQRAIDKVKF